MSRTFRSWILLAGDLFFMYAALALTLWLRGGGIQFSDFWQSHVIPFTILNLLWIAVFYIQDLYSRKHFRISGAFVRGFIKASFVNVLIVMAFFYMAPVFGISPKTNLLIYVMLFTGFFLIWRTLAGGYMTDARSRVPVVFLDVDDSFAHLVKNLEESDDSLFLVVRLSQPEEMIAAIASGNIELIVAPNREFTERREEFYQYLSCGVDVLDAATFWEEHHQQTPLHLADTNWFLTGLAKTQRREFELFKRTFDVVLSITLLIIFSGFAAAAAFFIVLTSPGSLLFRQTRLSRLGQPFTLFKFRSMRQDAEKDGPVWSQKGDDRVTKFGVLLRHTHFDEYPQLWNILKGDMSFIGPRPERPEFVADLKVQIPFYDLRHLVKPGITGWAQINYPYGASVEDAKRKLSYDLYYIKHRSWFLDFKICLKTLAMLFRGEGR